MRLRITFLVVLLLALASCCTSGQNGEETGSGCFILHILDWFFIPSATGTAPFQLLGMGLNVLIPGAGSLLTLAGTTYAGFRRASQWKRAMTSTAQTIETGAELGMSVADLKPHLADAHAMANVDHLVQPLVQKLTPDLVIPETP